MGYGDDADDGYEPYIDPNFFSECIGEYTTFQQLEEWKKTIPSHCMEQYIVGVEVAVLDAALDSYGDLVKNGYDKMFDIYQGYIAAQAPDQIDAFMASGKADKYFKCTETRKVVCCSDCHYASCAGKCDKSKNCKAGKGSVEITCPTTLKDGLDSITISSSIPNVTFSLQDSDGFWKNIGEEYGIEESWVKFGRKHIRTNNGCQYAGKDIKNCQDQQDDWWYNYPVVDNVKVYDPKDLIGKSYDKTRDLLDRLEIIRDNADYDELLQWSDVVDAGSLPAITTETAVEGMKQIVKVAQEIKKKEREELILGFVTAFLFFIPIVGEAAGSAGLSAARSLIALVGAAGDAGLTLYSIIEDPSNAFMSVFSYLAGAGVGRTGFSKAASARRAMTSDDIKKLGSVKKDLDTIESLHGTTCPV